MNESSATTVTVFIVLAVGAYLCATNMIPLGVAVIISGFFMMRNSLSH